MKQLIRAILPLWAGMALSLVGCEEVSVPVEGTAGGGTEGILTLTLGGNASLTKAVGDYVPEGVTTREEKEVRSLALFVKTEASGDEADFKPGAFARFLSESDKPEEQLSEPLTELGGDGSGLYSCQVKVHSYSWREPEVIAIANYAENGMAPALEKLATWEELLELTTAEPAAPGNALLTCPLLMYGHAVIKGWGTAPDGVPATQSVTLTRLAARVDVRNIGYDKDEPANGFELESVTLCDSRTRSYFSAADETLTLALPVADRPALEAKDIREVIEDGRTFQQAASLYTYEAPNTGEHPTFLRLDGKYKGSAISVKAEFKKTGADGKPAIVPVGRNHRYVVTLSNPLGDEAPASTIATAEWDATDGMEAGPAAEAPTLTDIQATLPDGASGTPGTYSEAGGVKTLDITNATAPTRLTFTASGKGFVADCYVTLRHDEGYDWSGRTVGEIDIEKSGFIRPEAYPGQLDRKFTITIPRRTADAATEGTPAYEAWIYVYNSSLGEAMKEMIRVKADRIDPVPAVP